MLKHIYKTLSIAAGCALALTSCDSVDENDRFIEIPQVETNRVVLLEEFTGQRCSNCPDAHEIVEKLLSQHSGNFISVSIHSDNPGTGSYPEPEGLYNEDGVAYCNANNVSVLPSGVVNRTGGILTMDQWAEKIAKAKETPAQMSIDLSAKYSQELNQIEIDTKISPYATINGILQLWVVEDSITAVQLFQGSTRPRPYVHNNVFRGAVNGIQGEAISMVIREDFDVTHYMKVKDFWDPDKLSIVAFVYNSEGVLQAAKAPVAPMAD